MKRRDFLFLSACSFVPRVSNSRGVHAEGKYLFSANEHAGEHYLSRVNRLSYAKESEKLPFRGHGLVSLDEKEILVFGRRPGKHCARVDFSRGEILEIDAAKGRHFYGHGCLSADKKAIFTTENDYKNAKGVIGIRDVETLKTIGEFPSHGIGPHDIHLMPDQQTLVVANGGVQTHPDFGRRQLNLKSMQSSLVYLDSQSGKKLGMYQLGDRLLSMRHLTVTSRGDVGVAAQYKGDIYRQVPQALVAWQSFSEPLAMLEIPKTDLEHCRGYMADLAYDFEQKILAVTSPRGNRVTFWDVETKKYLYSLGVPEVSGIQFLSQGRQFLVSNAKGYIQEIRATHQAAHISRSVTFSTSLWDNHLLVI